ncbi:MAG: hypothetical protein ABIJ56_22750 [Pseudomonadota bacterium]
MENDESAAAGHVQQETAEQGRHVTGKFFFSFRKKEHRPIGGKQKIQGPTPGEKEGVGACKLHFFECMQVKISFQENATRTLRPLFLRNSLNFSQERLQNA